MEAWHSAFTEFKLAFKIFEVGKYQIILETFLPNPCFIMLKSSSKLSISTVSRLDYVFITNKLKLCFCSTVWKSLNFSLIEFEQNFVKSRLLCVLYLISRNICQVKVKSLDFRTVYKQVLLFHVPVMKTVSIFTSKSQRGHQITF